MSSGNTNQQQSSNDHNGNLNLNVTDPVHAVSSQVSPVLDKLTSVGYDSTSKDLSAPPVVRADIPGPSDYLGMIVAVESTLSALASTVLPTATVTNATHGFLLTTSFTSPSTSSTSIPDDAYRSSLQVTSASSALLPSGSSAIQNYLFPLSTEDNPTVFNQVARPDVIAVAFIVVVLFIILITFFFPRLRGGKPLQVPPDMRSLSVPQRQPRYNATEDDIESGVSKEEAERVREGLASFKFPRPEPEFEDIYVSH